MEFVATITLDHTGDTGAADALLDAFLAGHAQASPIVGEDLQAHTIDITFAVDARGRLRGVRARTLSLRDSPPSTRSSRAR